MRFNTLASIAAMLMFLVYFIPIVIKLKDIPLAIVILGGVVLVAVDLWESRKH